MGAVAANQDNKNRYVDNGWPETDGEPAVSELRTDRAGALSPFGDVVFPLPSDTLPYLHPVTSVNR
jgi:hypothetical protein